MPRGCPQIFRFVVQVTWANIDERIVNIGHRMAHARRTHQRIHHSSCQQMGLLPNKNPGYSC